MLRSLLVHLDGSPRCAARLRLALDLAQRHDATLTAVYASMPPMSDMPYTYAASAIAPQLLQEMEVQRRQLAKDNFDAAQRRSPVPMAWVELREGLLPKAVAEQALYADLLVLGQPDPGESPARQVPGDFVESVLITSGRPALVLPYAGDLAGKAPRGSTVLVAWKASAEAARALSAATPLLRNATSVHVVSWAEEPVPSLGETLNVERYLRLHGITATMHRERQVPQEIGERLLSMAADLDAQMLVMGCYGRSRALEFILGGASRTVLRSMTLPVLMSH